MLSLTLLGQNVRRKLFRIKVPDNSEDEGIFRNLHIPPDAAENGVWSAVYDFPLAASHAAILRDGRLVAYGSPVNTAPAQRGNYWVVWDPAKGYGRTAMTIHSNNSTIDSFCTSASLVNNGRLLVAGGNANGETSTVLFNPRNHRTAKLTNLNEGRCHGTMTKLADGSVVMTGGRLSARSTAAPEMWNPTSQTWQMLSGASNAELFGPDFRWW